MQRITKYIGLDIHRDTIAVAVADAGRDTDRTAPRDHGIIPNTESALRSLIRRLGRRPERLHFCYEAGPTGFPTYHFLIRIGASCDVIAPSLIPKRSGDRVKTDRRDARSLAALLRAGELRAIVVPGAEQEALRDLTRAREDVLAVQLRARQRVSSFLLRHGRAWPNSPWTLAHGRWLTAQEFEAEASTAAFAEYVLGVRAAEVQVGRLTTLLGIHAARHPDAAVIRALSCLRGVKLVTAATIVAELGDLTRFDTAAQLMAYVGLVPSEHSSGRHTRRGRITRTGNGHARRVLVEAAWQHRHPARLAGELKKRQEGQPIAVQQIAWKAQQRLCRRYTHMTRDQCKPAQVAVVAIARELVGFMWSIARTVATTDAAATAVATSATTARA